MNFGGAARYQVFFYGGSESRLLTTSDDEFVSVRTVEQPGVLLGFSVTPITSRVFSWTQHSGLRTLGVLEVPRAETSVLAINSKGQAAGYVFERSTPSRLVAFTWTKQSGIVELGTLGGATSVASAINDDGEVIGNADTVDGNSHAFAWTKHAGMLDLGTLGGVSSNANAFNDAAQVVGTAYVPGGASHAFIWSHRSGMRDLGTLGGDSSSASVVSPSGRVVGSATTAMGARHAFLWTDRHGMLDLGSFVRYRMVWHWTVSSACRAGVKSLSVLPATAVWCC